MSAENFQAWTQGQASSAITLVICSAVSFIAVVYILTRITWVATKSTISDSTDRRKTKAWMFFSTPLGWYTASLLIANALTCVHGMLEVTWIAEKGITTGNSTCGVQAAFEQVGNFATSYFMISIAVHGFNGLVRRRRFPLWACTLYMFVGWTSSIVIGVIAPRLSRLHYGPVYGSDGYACSITLEYPLLEFVFQLLPIIVTALVSAILFAVMFLILRGTVQVRSGISFNLNRNFRWTGVGTDSEEYQRFIGAIVRTMLLYPFVYTLLHMPLTLVRLVALSKMPVSFGAGVFASSCRLLIGFANSLIVYKILCIVRPAIDATVRSSGSGESFSVPELKPSPIEAPTTEPAKAFPPPRKSAEGRHPPSIRSRPSLASISTNAELRHPLLSQHPYMHTHTRSTSSDNSFMTGISLNRVITPAAELDRAIATPPRIPRQEVPIPRIDTSSSLNSLGRSASRGSTESLGLPPPPRPNHSFVSRKPLPLPPKEAIPTTPAIDDESSGDPIIPAEHRGPPQWSSGYYDESSNMSTSAAQPVPLDLSSRPSITAVTTTLPPMAVYRHSDHRPDSHYSDERADTETGVAGSVDSRGRLPSLAWATLVANAATQDVGGMALSSFNRRTPPLHRGDRDVPLDVDPPVPAALQPCSPSFPDPVFRVPTFGRNGRTRQASTDSWSVGSRSLTPEPKFNTGLRESGPATRQNSIVSRMASPTYL
ncbi:hypothetical protein NEOLEDRAFT_460954 [Neolentinus lepideus HHB14362 ss-1]|uniref:Glucose receptor Git3 N-terminal domain-containing protein n=1 Tax=Neolentinus lepideus HHB14362 ss-1 TaxID=1314782 RepID=A0A165VGM7_9AGAM|nr:hypothetical protein NEOLEDRAFT_460954 [Neolentinus lepideus HHB14362 ss-1]